MLEAEWYLKPASGVASVLRGTHSEDDVRRISQQLEEVFITSLNAAVLCNLVATATPEDDADCCIALFAALCRTHRHKRSRSDFIANHGATICFDANHQITDNNREVVMTLDSENSNGPYNETMCSCGHVENGDSSSNDAGLHVSAQEPNAIAFDKEEERLLEMAHVLHLRGASAVSLSILLQPAFRHAHVFSDTRKELRDLGLEIPLCCPAGNAASCGGAKAGSSRSLRSFFPSSGLSACGKENIPFDNRTPLLPPSGRNVTIGHCSTAKAPSLAPSIPSYLLTHRKAPLGEGPLSRPPPNAQIYRSRPSDPLRKVQRRSPPRERGKRPVVLCPRSPPVVNPPRELSRGNLIDVPTWANACVDDEGHAWEIGAQPSRRQMTFVVEETPEPSLARSTQEREESPAFKASIGLRLKY